MEAGRNHWLALRLQLKYRRIMTTLFVLRVEAGAVGARLVTALVRPVAVPAVINTWWAVCEGFDLLRLMLFIVGHTQKLTADGRTRCTTLEGGHYCRWFGAYSRHWCTATLKKRLDNASAPVVTQLGEQLTNLLASSLLQTG